jgi:hypothetical protein
VYLQVAKLRFVAGEPDLGYESLSQYVASDSPKAGTALQVALVDPIRGIKPTSMQTQPAAAVPAATAAQLP